MHSSQNELPRDLQNYSNTDDKSSEYNRIVQGLIDGNYILYVPTQNDGKIENKWKTLDKGSKLQLKSVFDVDGLKVLAAFSSESSLSEWSKNQSKYTAINSKDILALCESNGIDQIVIDSQQSTMFVLGRSSNHIKTKEIKQATTVSIRSITKNVDEQFLERLITQSSEVGSVKEIYQYEMIRDEEEILMFGFHLSEYTDQSRTACVHAVQNSILTESFHLPLEIFFLEDHNWLDALNNMPNALVWERM